MKDLTGDKFGKLTVLSLHEVRRYSGKHEQTKPYWKTICECGTEKIVRGEHMKSGRTISCGCVSKQIHSNRLKTHGLSKSSEYRNWTSMKNRVFSKDSHHAKYYSDITIKESWLGKNGFVNFLNDMGRKPSVEHEIDRINPYGNYEPSNCRWATRSEQMNNLKRHYQNI